MGGSVSLNCQVSRQLRLDVPGRAYTQASTASEGIRPTKYTVHCATQRRSVIYVRTSVLARVIGRDIFIDILIDTTCMLKFA